MKNLNTALGEELRSHIIAESGRQSKERKLKNELLAIKYEMQDYARNENIENELHILDFVKKYLKTLNLTQSKLASVFEMESPNLHKYLKGERKLNPDLVLKLSSFFHTNPEIWYYVQTSNELRKLKEAQKNKGEYAKYDYNEYVEIT